MSEWGAEFLDERTRDLVRGVLDCAFEVHRALGPGFLESVYRRCLVHALERSGLAVAEEVPFDVRFGELVIPRAYRADIVVDGRVVVEVKAADVLLPVHSAQVIAYLKASGLSAGVLLNFNVRYLRSGYDRFVHPDLFRRGIAASPTIIGRQVSP